VASVSCDVRGCLRKRDFAMWLVRCLMVIEFSLCMVCFANVSCTYSDT